MRKTTITSLVVVDSVSQSAARRPTGESQKGVDAMKRYLFPAAVIATVVILSSVLAGIASAKTNSIQTTCPSGYTCIPANKTTTNTSKSQSSSHTKIVIKSTIKAELTQYEQV